MTIGWVTVAHAPTNDEEGLDDELNSIGILVDIGDGVTFEMVRAKSYEIEAAVLSAFAGPEFDDVEWWTYSQDTYLILREQVPELSLMFGNISCSQPILQMIDFQTELPPENTPLGWTYHDWHMWLAVSCALNMVGADLTSKIDRLLS